MNESHMGPQWKQYSAGPSKLPNKGHGPFDHGSDKFKGPDDGGSYVPAFTKPKKPSPGGAYMKAGLT